MTRKPTMEEKFDNFIDILITLKEGSDENGGFGVSTMDLKEIAEKNGISNVGIILAKMVANGLITRNTCGRKVFYKVSKDD